MSDEAVVVHADAVAEPVPGGRFQPPANCAHGELVEPETLVPHPRNPNRHSAEQLKLLAKIVAHQGWRSPVVVSKRSGFIVAGHARHQVAIALGCLVPVDRQDFATEADEYAHMIADNRIAELAEPDLPTLKSLLGDLDTGAFDMDLTAFTAPALEGMMTALPPLDDPSAGHPLEQADGTVPESTVRMVQLFFTQQGWEEFQRIEARLRVHFGTANITDTVTAAVRAMERECESSSSTPA